ncbi:MAG: helix-turn-helix domain-containing protein [Solirubrobacteraceae bacterium]
MTGRPLKRVDADASAAARLGAELRARRVERELTLTQLGDEIGFSAQYISGAELAKTAISARFVAACDHALVADGAIVALLPEAIWEKDGRRDERDHRAPGPHTASAHGGTVVACEVDPALAEHCTSLLAIFGAHDAAHGPRAVLPVAQRQLQMLTTQRETARGDLRTEVMRIEARWAVHVAWLCEDTGDRRGRAALLEHALQLAREADAPDLVAWVRARQAQWTDPFNAIRLAEAGLRTPRASAHTRALCGVRAALAHARIGDRDTTARLLADAHMLVGQESPPPPLAADTSLSGFLVRCWEARCQAVLEPATGMALYDEVLRDWPPAIGRRDRGLYQARLAIAYATAGELDRARAEGRTALAIARATNSTTIARELRQLHDLLRA